uniref:Uncharacterized protein n=1 Tax=Bos indicus x Bos taurus TaxID=30522 RepID=A0A4W2DG96_BOBOX
MLLTRFEQENGHLAQVDEVFGFTCHITTEVPPHDAVPGGVVLLVELLLDMGHNVLLYIISLQCLSSTLHQVLLHLLRHIVVLDLSLSVTHGYQGAGAGRLQRTLAWKIPWTEEPCKLQSMGSQRVGHN